MFNQNRHFLLGLFSLFYITNRDFDYINSYKYNSKYEVWFLNLIYFALNKTPQLNRHFCSNRHTAFMSKYSGMCKWIIPDIVGMLC